MFYGWWIVFAGFGITMCIGSVVFFGFTAFFEPLVEEFGWSYTQVSFAASLRGMEMGIFAPVSGFLVDRFGSRIVTLIGTVTVGFALVLLSFTQSLAMFYASFVLLAFGAGGCTSVVTMSAVANWFDRKAGLALGVTACGFGASGLIIPLIVWLIKIYHWRTSFFILGLGIWALGIPLSLVIRNRPETYGLLPDGKPMGNPARGHEVQQKEGVLSFREALLKRSFMYLNISEAIRLMILVAVVTHIMPYLSSIGVSRTTAGMVAAGVPLFSIIGRSGFGWLSDMFEKRYVLAAACCFMGAGVFFLSQAEARWTIFIFLLLFSPGFGGIMVLRGSILRDYFGRDHFGKMIGISMGCGALGGIIGPTVAGWVYDSFGTYHSIWLVFSCLAILAITLALRVTPGSDR